MEWTDDGIVLAARRHGEASVIVQLLTRDHGRHAGLVRGGAGRRARGVYQPGNEVRATWRARLADHLGNYTCEPLVSHAADIMAHRGTLAALSSACALIEAALPERAPHPTLYKATHGLLRALDRGGGDGGWAEAYVWWELGFLAEMGFGLDLSRCAATGVNDELVYVSPKSGRAVSASAGEPYRDKLLPLPAFLVRDEAPDPPALGRALELTGHFLEHHIFGGTGRTLPAARLRLADIIVSRR